MGNRHLAILFVAVLFCSVLFISLHIHHADVEASSGCAICKCADDLSSADNAPPGPSITPCVLLTALDFDSLVRATRVPTVSISSRAPPSFPAFIHS